MDTLLQIHQRIVNSPIGSILTQVEEKNAVAKLSKAVSIYILMNYTINPIEPFLKYYFYESDFQPDITFGNYDSIQQDVLDDKSALYAKQFDAIVCSLCYMPTDAKFLQRLREVDSFINELKNLFDLIQRKTNASVFINTFLLPFHTMRTLAHADKIHTINQFILDYAAKQSNRFYVMDWNHYIHLVGEQESIDYRYWYLYKAPFKKNFLSHYAADITNVIRSIYGLAKKCLILDCDNTLWGGIIGEDGLTGIRLDSQEYPGKIYYDFQQTVLALAERGIILALCSKNNENDVWEVMDKHPHSLLRRKHIAAYRINWMNKADNILSLVQELNIGLDSCVFIDDSLTECDLVKAAIPEMTVLPVPKALYSYPSLLFAENVFNPLGINSEDSNRNLQYQQEAERKAIKAHYLNMEDYLASLQLKILIHPSQAHEIPRVAQLTQKTNQFNLTTQRYTAQQIQTLMQTIDTQVFSLSVEDKFGDYGLTGVMIAKRIGQEGWIDSFLLSCRILSRNIEYLFLEHVLKKLSIAWNIHLWNAEYKPTEKNAQIRPFLEKADFKEKTENIYGFNTLHWQGYNLHYLELVDEMESA